MSDQTMATPRKVSETHRIIWLDAEIGKEGECIEFKRRFVTSVEPGARVEDPIDVCIRALHENACPFIFVHQPEDAIKAIEENHDKRIIFISSGSMGVHIVPEIRASFINVYSFYIFCAIPANYMNLVMDNLGCLQVFNYETDLLVRLMRDIAKEIIASAEAYRSMDFLQDALDCFTRARNLYKTANDQDKLHPPILSDLYSLEGPDGHSGKIGELEQLILARKRQPHSLDRPVQIRESVAEQIAGDEDDRMGME